MELLDLPEGRLAVALGIGLVIGAERERRKGDGPSRRGAGIRTFAIVALLGGVVAMLESESLLVISALVVRNQLGTKIATGSDSCEQLDVNFSSRTDKIGYFGKPADRRSQLTSKPM